MAWKIEISHGADQALSKLDPQHAKRILKFLRDRVAPLGNPRSIGKALKGSDLGEFWRYRVGDYRIICRIEDARLVVLVLRVADRKDIYR